MKAHEPGVIRLPGLDPIDKLLRLAWLLLGAVAAGAMWMTTINIKTNDLTERMYKVEAKVDTMREDLSTVKNEVGTIKNDVSWVRRDLEARE